MNYLKQVQTGVDYIEANLDTEFSLADVAQAACMSQWHFQRIFKALTNETLKAYIRSRRIANSLDALLFSESSILEIAVDAGFETHESYTRAFQKMFDLTPSNYRKRAEKSLILRKAQFDIRYLQNIAENISLEPDIYSVGERHFVGIKTPVHGVDSEKNNLAEKLPPLWEGFIPRLTEIQFAIPDTCYGLIEQSQEKPGQLEYTACIEVSRINITTIPEDMTVVTLPAQQYAQFTHKGLMNVDNLNNTVNYIYSSWLLRSELRHTFAPDLEIYGPEFAYQSEDSVVYYAIPVE